MEGQKNMPKADPNGYNGTKKSAKKQKKRKVYDAIHGFIYFPQVVWDFIDTPPFPKIEKNQAIRNSQYVFPTATHTRFEHSIGTAHLAKKFTETLIDNHPDLYENEDKEEAILTATLGGLLHDIGHGPYSHMFDGHVVTQITHDGQTEKWTHETASELILEHMTKLQELKGKLTPHQIQRVKALISGVKNDERAWEFQLISNKLNGIDVDKLDYFRRDAFYLGAKNIYIDHDLLMNQARIINKEICYPSKYIEIVNNIFHSRYKLYKSYYNNPINMGIEHMVCDVLELTKEQFEIQRACQEIYTDPSRYLRLNDSILERVEDVYERIKTQEAKEPQNSIKDPNVVIHRKKFKQAMAIIKRMRSRKLYKFVKELTYYVKQNQYEKVRQVFENEFKNNKILQAVAEQSDIEPSKIFVTINDVGYGLKESNPIRKVGFFRKQQEEPYTKLQQSEIESLSMLFTHTHFQRSVKVFVKEDNPDYFVKIDRAVNIFRLKHQEVLKFDSGKLGKTPVVARQANQNLPGETNPLGNLAS